MNYSLPDYLQGSSPFDLAIATDYTENQEDSSDITLDIQFPNVLYDSGKIHTVIEGETLQNIAYSLWNDSGLWYLLAMFNDISNPFTELTPGRILKIPING